MRVASTLAAAFAPLVDFLYPPRCPVCGGAIGNQAGLCLACWSDLEIPGEPACATCQRPMAQDHAAPHARCAPCLADPPRHDGIYAATIYGPVPRAIVLAFKHGGRIAYSPMMARLMAARLPVDDTKPVIVPVPLHRWRLWRRGYNQAALLAGALAKLNRGEVEVDLLRRTRNTPPLGGLGRKARAKTMRSAIALAPGKAGRIAGRTVLLVDDVLTSGATTDACVAALLRGGASEVRIACFSRVVDSETGYGTRKSEAPGVPGTPGAA